MSSLRIKFLKRKKILQEHVRIALEEQGRVRRFTADLDLSSYDFPTEAVVLIEAKTLLQTLRFRYGTVGLPSPPAPRDISQLKSERITFNILVLDPVSSRKYGSAETIRPLTTKPPVGGVVPLLPVELSDDLGGLLWRVDFSDDDGEGHADAPILVFERRAAQDSAAVFVKDVAVRAMVLPAALRDVLVRVLLVDRHEYAGDSAAWRDAWLRMGVRLAGEEPPPVADSSYSQEALSWIETAVGRLATRADFLEDFVQERRV